jgi:hypothetical protein
MILINPLPRLPVPITPILITSFSKGEPFCESIGHPNAKEVPKNPVVLRKFLRFRVSFITILSL